MARRQKTPRSLKPIVKIFCEGKTERIYVSEYKRENRLTIGVEPALLKKKNHIDVLQEAIDFVNNRTETDPPIDAVFVLIDLDNLPKNKQHDYGQKKQQLERLNVETSAVCASYPCFEIWILAHYNKSDLTSHYANCQAVINKLKKQVAEYKKGVVPQNLFANTQTAIKNAQYLYNMYQQGSTINKTDVDQMVVYFLNTLNG